jgi:flagellar protein FliS
MTTEMTYRRASVAGASPMGLMIALFDTLVGDFGRAAAALRRNDIETRCKELNHATLVLGQLESWVDLNTGGEAAKDLSRFYAHLRAKMIEAAGTKSAKLLEEQINLILLVRSSWQQLDTALVSESEESASTQVARSSASYSQASDAMPDRVPFSQSA